MKENKIQIKKRHLPHWTLKGSFYFITFRVLRENLSQIEQKLVLRHIINGDKTYYRLVAAIVMPDHVHQILMPNAGYSLSRIMKGIKGVTSRQINLLRKTSGQIWQHESFDRIIRNDSEYLEKLNYMLNNSVKRGLVDDPWEYYGWHINRDIHSQIDNS